MQQPTLGRIVHYILTGADGPEGNVRAAIVSGGLFEGNLVNLQVFLDGPNDHQNGPGVMWVGSVPEGTEPGTWHWPPRT